MQKLFSMFPRGAPGLALLMLRLYIGARALGDALTASAPGGVLTGAHVATALAITIGIMTPIAGALLTLIAAVEHAVLIQAAPIHAFAPTVIALALALLGPGAYSLDARLFARRLMAFEPNSNDQK